MERAQNFFQNFDMFAAPASLRAKGSSSVTRTSAGFLSFVLLCYFVYIFVSGMYHIFIFSSIVSSQTFQKIPLSQLHAQTFMFGVGNLNLEPQFIITQFEIKIQIKSTKQGVIYNMTTMPCKPDQWRQLGQDYQEQFKLHYLDRFFCPSEPQKLKIINSSLVQEATYFQIVILPCNSSNPQLLASKLNKLEDFEANKFNLFFLDQAVIPNEQDAVQYFININNFAFYSTQKKHKTLIRLSNFKISTDYSIIPIYQDLQIERGNSIEDFVLTDTDTMAGQENCKIRFQLTNDQFIYTRKVGKIDEMFSYAGGLFALCIWCLGFFIASFNKYRYELMVAEGIFNYDKDGHKYRQNQFGFIKYVKYATYLWIKQYFCCQPKWNQCIKIQKTINEAKKQMDVINLFRRLQFLEMSLIFATNDSQNSIIALTEFRSLDQVRQQRLQLEYYEAVIQGQPAATVQDAINGTAQRFRNLKKSPLKYKSKQRDYQQIVEERSITNKSLLIQQDEQIKDRMMKYLKISQFPAICQAISKYPVAQQQAKLVILTPELERVQKHLTQHFLNLKLHTKIKIMKKIPLKIIHRLCMVGQKLVKKQIESSLDLKHSGFVSTIKEHPHKKLQQQKGQNFNQET